MSSDSPKPAKRSDLQGIRGIAIISVLIFHFFPAQFPNGYLGVDQFFVLSGFLMCMLLKKAEEQRQSPHSLVFTFYSKRFKRILPLYFLVILLTMISLYIVFPDTALELNKASATRAALFVSNRPKGDAEGYFEMISASTDVFSHTWSLSVEIQFYFLVPFMFLLASVLSEKLQYVHYLAIGTLSIIYHLTSADEVAFNNVFARIWQFLIGMIVYMATNSKRDYLPLNETEQLLDQEPLLEKAAEKSSKNRKQNVLMIIKYILIVSFLGLIASNITFEASIVRPLTTILTGFLILVSENDNILSNKALTYIGDISYSLYLLHWPICAYCKLTFGANQYVLLSGLLFSVFLAVITYETFEKWYLQLSSFNIGILIVLLFFVNAIVINQDDIVDYLLPNTIGKNQSRLDGITDDLTIDDAERFNHRWNIKEYYNLRASTCVYERRNTPFGWCRHQGLAPSSKYKMVIFGNSWTANHATLFYQECGNKAKSILQGSETSCEPLYPTVGKSSCEESFREFETRIREEKPDYGFIITRFHTVGQAVTSEEAASNTDPIYDVMIKQTRKLVENIKKKLYILNAIPNPAAKNTERIVDLLKEGTDPVKIDKMVVDMNHYKTARQRYAKLEKECGEKCELIDYEPIFFNNSTKTFRYFDEKGFAYMTRGLHISPRGLEHVRPIWHNICEKL